MFLLRTLSRNYFLTLFRQYLTMSIVIVQTCDGQVYKPILDLSEQVSKAYCNKHGYFYYRYDGVVRGVHPWHAAFNRIYIFEAIAREHPNIKWILYMDADAVIVDLEKPLDSFLDDNYAVIGCKGGSDDPRAYWDINNGVMFLNLHHPAANDIIQKWKQLYENVPLSRLEAETQASFDKIAHCDDQYLLQCVLVTYKPPVSLNYQGDKASSFNYNGNFIQQILRVPGIKTIADRTQEMKQIVEKLI